MDRAIDLLEEGIRRGEPESFGDYGVMCANGCGRVPRDLERAREFCGKAVEMGFEGAEAPLAWIEARLSEA